MQCAAPVYTIQKKLCYSECCVGSPDCSLYLNLRRSRDGAFVREFVHPFGVRIHSVRFGQLLRCAHQRIVNIMKLYVESNNIQVELIRFRKKISTLFTFTFANR